MLNISNVVVIMWQTFASKLGSSLWIYVANSVPFALWFNTFGIVAQLEYRKWRQFGDRYFVEKYYIILSLSTKIAVFWISLSTFRQVLEDNNVVLKAGVRWDVVRYMAMILPASWLVGFSIVDALQWRAYRRRMMLAQHAR